MVQSQPGSRSLPALVIGPPGHSIEELFEQPDQWPDVRAITGSILTTGRHLKRFSDAELRQWFAAMRAWRIGLEIELGAIKDWGPTANDTFRAEAPMLDRLIRLGADLHSVVMDEPLIASRKWLHQPDLYAVEETARFVVLVRGRYPGVLIGDVEPYPAISVEDHAFWLHQLQDQLRRLNVSPLDFYRIDADWTSFERGRRGNWSDVRSLENATHAAGLPFSLIYWASGLALARSQGRPTEGMWCEKVLEQVKAAANADVRPDQYVVESWIDAPRRMVPQNSTGCTFTKSIFDLVQRLK